MDRRKFLKTSGIVGLGGLFIGVSKLLTKGTLKIEATTRDVGEELKDIDEQKIDDAIRNDSQFNQERTNFSQEMKTQLLEKHPELKESLEHHEGAWIDILSAMIVGGSFIGLVVEAATEKKFINLIQRPLEIIGNFTGSQTINGIVENLRSTSYTPGFTEKSAPGMLALEGLRIASLAIGGYMYKNPHMLEKANHELHETELSMTIAGGLTAAVHVSNEFLQFNPNAVTTQFDSGLQAIDTTKSENILPENNKDLESYKNNQGALLQQSLIKSMAMAGGTAPFSTTYASTKLTEDTEHEMTKTAFNYFLANEIISLMQEKNIDNQLDISDEGFATIQQKAQEKTNLYMDEKNRLTMAFTSNILGLGIFGDPPNFFFAFKQHGLGKLLAFSIPNLLVANLNALSNVSGLLKDQGVNVDWKKISGCESFSYGSYYKEVFTSTVKSLFTSVGGGVKGMLLSLVTKAEQHVGEKVIQGSIVHKKDFELYKNKIELLDGEELDEEMMSMFSEKNQSDYASVDTNKLGKWTGTNIPKAMLGLVQKISSKLGFDIDLTSDLEGLNNLKPQTVELLQQLIDKYNSGESENTSLADIFETAKELDLELGHHDHVLREADRNSNEENKDSMLDRLKDTKRNRQSDLDTAYTGNALLKLGEFINNNGSLQESFHAQCTGERVDRPKKFEESIKRFTEKQHTSEDLAFLADYTNAFKAFVSGTDSKTVNPEDLKNLNDAHKLATLFKLPKGSLGPVINLMGLGSIDELLCHPAIETITALSNQIPAVPALITLIMEFVINPALNKLKNQGPMTQLMVAGTLGMFFAALVTTVADNVAAYEMLEGIFESVLIKLYGVSKTDPTKSVLSIKHDWLRASLGNVALTDSVTRGNGTKLGNGPHFMITRPQIEKVSIEKNTSGLRVIKDVEVRHDEMTFRETLPSSLNSNVDMGKGVTKTIYKNANIPMMGYALANLTVSAFAIARAGERLGKTG